MNSLTRKLIVFQLIIIQIGMSKLVKSINGNDILSSPNSTGPQEVLILSDNQLRTWVDWYEVLNCSVTHNHTEAHKTKNENNRPIFFIF